MAMMNKSENVKSQYSDDKNLSVRMRLHGEYSTAKVKFYPWLFENYKFSEGDKILELGCGNGGQWEYGIKHLPESCSLTLSDFSDGMIDIIREKYFEYDNVSAQKIDIQDIPYPDESFDVVIANHMLYHVPDIEKALSEVNRVLKSGGVFYSATNGSGGMQKYLNDAFNEVYPGTRAFKGEFSFNLQNGDAYLNRYFSKSKRIDHEDSLSITKTQDLIDWLKSTITISSNLTEDIVDAMYDYFERIRKSEGAINIPKETGLFISVKRPAEISDNVDITALFEKIDRIDWVSYTTEYGSPARIPEYLKNLFSGNIPSAMNATKDLKSVLYCGYACLAFASLPAYDFLMLGLKVLEDEIKYELMDIFEEFAYCTDPRYCDSGDPQVIEWGLEVRNKIIRDRAVFETFMLHTDECIANPSRKIIDSLKKRPGKFVFNNLGVNSFNPDEVSLAREYGFGLEISDYLWSLSPGELKKKKLHVKKLKKGFFETSFHGTAVSRNIREINLMSDDELMKLYDESVKLADYHDINDIVFHSNYIPGVHPADGWIERTAEFWRKFIYTKSFDLHFYIENLADDSPDILVRLIDEIGDSRVNVCFDTGHANCNSKIPVTEWIKTLGDSIGYVHLHNNDGISDTHQPLSTGTIDFREVFDCFEKHLDDNIPYILECDLKESLVWLEDNGFA